MTELPGFDEQPPQYEFAKKEGNPVHVRQEGNNKDVGTYLCDFPSCNDTAKSKAGLASHFRAKHQPSVDDAFDNDIVTVYAKASIQGSALYDKDKGMWVAPVNIKIPEGFMIYDIDTRMKSMMLNERAYNTHQIILVKEDKMHKINVEVSK